MLGGFLIDHVGWRGIFVIYVPLGVLAAIILSLTLRLPSPSARPPVDYLGALSLATAVIGIVLLGATRNLIFAGLAAAGVAVWVLSGRVAADPILPLRLFRDRGFAIPVSVSFLIGFALIRGDHLPADVLASHIAPDRHPGGFGAHCAAGRRADRHSGVGEVDHPNRTLQGLPSSRDLDRCGGHGPAGSGY